MSRPRLDVQFCVLCHTVRRYGTNPTWDLLGLNYLQVVPPDTEYPSSIPHLDLFARFLVAGLGPTEIGVRVLRLDDDGSIKERVSSYQFTVPFAPTDRVRDDSFRLPNIRLTGDGSYLVRIGHPYRHRWKGLRWRTLATDHFYVMR